MRNKKNHSGWIDQDFKFSIECNPLSINEVKEVIE